MHNSRLLLPTACLLVADRADGGGTGSPTPRGGTPARSRSVVGTDAAFLVADLDSYSSLEDARGKGLAFGVQSGTGVVDIIEAGFTSTGDAVVACMDRRDIDDNDTGRGRGAR